MNSVFKVLTRKKPLDPISAEQSELGRVLNTFDLTALGVGSTLGVGVYVLAGHVAKDTAGPSVVLSFLIATIASVFAGLCYAEFGARAPRAGSAYIYSYVCVGEFVAFVIGWNLILEYVIGSASVAKGLSLYLDTLLNDTMKNCFKEIAPLGDVSFISSYFDFFAFGISLVLAIALAFGLKESTWANNIFTLINLLVVGFVIIAGSTKANTENWRLNYTNCSRDEFGCTSFFPYGIEGMIKGAATCFYGFVGFDCIATTGEEAKNPKKAIPIAIILSLFIIFLAYFGTSTVVTLMLPYYLQDGNAPLPHAFSEVGLDWAKWVVAIGAIFGLCASLFGAMFPLPRIIYAMASDSLIFSALGRVNSTFQTPVIGTLIAGFLTGLMGAIFELKQLVNMMSIGTLLAYTIVAASVLLLRFQADKDDTYAPLLASNSESDDNRAYTASIEFDNGTDSYDERTYQTVTAGNVFRQLYNFDRQQTPSNISEKIVKLEVCIYCLLCIFIGLCAMFLKQYIGQSETWAIVLTAIVVGFAVLILMSIATQPKSRKELSFKVPLVPLIPALSILINIYLMLMLDVNTWIRFGVWMLIGLPTYYFSVKTHSGARNESLCSRQLSLQANGTIHTLTNGEPKKRQAPPPPPPTLNVEATIAQLDEIIESEEANLKNREFRLSTSNDRKLSLESLSLASNVLSEENVTADVHCSNSPLPCDPQNTDTVSISNSHTSEPKERETKQEENISTDEINDDNGKNDLTIPTDAEPEYSNVDESASTVDTKDTPIEVEDKDSSIEEKVIIPPPPPLLMELLQREPNLPREINALVTLRPRPENKKETSDIKQNDSTLAIPRPLIRLSAIATVKLKPIEQKPPPTPDIDYLPQNSRTPPDDHNLRPGTQEYKVFLEQLNTQLQQNNAPPVVHVDLTRRVIPKTPKPNVDVIDDHIDQDDAKQKLAQFLEKSGPLVPMMQEVEDVDVKNDLGFSGASGTILGLDLNRTEKPRRVQDDTNNDRMQHKQNMDVIFQSIRLRKVDSFKNQESH